MRIKEDKEKRPSTLKIRYPCLVFLFGFEKEDNTIQ